MCGFHENLLSLVLDTAFGMTQQEEPDKGKLGGQVALPRVNVTRMLFRRLDFILHFLYRFSMERRYSWRNSVAGNSARIEKARFLNNFFDTEFLFEIVKSGFKIIIFEYE